MVVDVNFFKNLVKLLEVDHNIVRNLDNITESWKQHVDATIHQCKEMINIAKYQEERDAIFKDFSELVAEIEGNGLMRVYKVQIEDLDNDE